LGRQGSGKGTQAQRLSALYGVSHISTGDAFRAAVAAGSAIGRQARGYLDRGELVPDAVTIGVVEECLGSLPPAPGGRPAGFILDGFPRNLNQARALEDILGPDSLDVVVDLEASTEEVLKRLSARRVCSNCGTVFNLVDRPPKVPGRCDVCGGALAQREDDTEAAIRRRLELYESETAPVASWYAERGLLARVDAMGPADEVTSRVVAVVEAARGRKVARP
jgi:adenylate kinase